MTCKWPQDEPRDVAARVERCGQRLTVNSASRLRPRAAVWLTWLPAQAPLPGHNPGSPGRRLAQPRGNLGFPNDPQAWAAEV